VISIVKRIFILTGAGISAESGVPTFRDAGGLWEGHDVMEVASPEGFRRSPGLVHRFYNQRRADIQLRVPNAAHQAIAELQTRYPEQVTLVTQNVDDLHERGGSPSVIHMHGELLRVRCSHCGYRCGWSDALSAETICPACQRSSGMRPDIVWFGEVPFLMDVIEEQLRQADAFVAIGTSGLVYPAAGLVSIAKSLGIRTIELNLQKTEASHLFDEVIPGPASQTVPRWCRSC
jgi:NAD-dependent deacetylase